MTKGERKENPPLYEREGDFGNRPYMVDTTSLLSHKGTMELLHFLATRARWNYFTS
jgi:hypothetical protein